MLTIRDLLDLDPLIGTEVLAGQQGLDRLVQRTVVIEVPEVLAQTVEGDLLLTSVDTFQPHHDAFVAMFDALRQRQIAGILIKGRLQQQTVDPDLLEAADTYHLPLLHLNSSVSYSEIIMAFATELLERQSRLMRRSEGLRQRFMSAMLSGGSAQRIAHLLSKEVGGNSVIIADASQRRLAAYCPLHEVCTTASAGEEQHLRFTEIGSHLAVQGAGDVQTLHGAGWAVQWLRWTVAVEQMHLGYVYLHACKRKLVHADTVALEQASASVALEMLKLRAQHDMEQRRTAFVTDLVAGNLQDVEEAARTASALGWQLALPVQLLLFGARDPAQIAWDAVDMRALATRHLAIRNQHDILWPHAPCLMLAYGVDSHASANIHREQGIETANRVQNALAQQTSQEIYAGIGQIAESITQIPLAYAQAHQSLRLAQTLPLGRSAMHFNDVGIYQILVRHPNSDDLRTFMLDTLGPLIRNDLETQNELVHSLQIYLAYDRNARAAADQLGLHYNSLRYRLQRIAEILGTEWDEPSFRLNVEIALKILSLYATDTTDLSGLARYL